MELVALTLLINIPTQKQFFKTYFLYWGTYKKMNKSWNNALLLRPSNYLPFSYTT